MKKTDRGATLRLRSALPNVRLCVLLTGSLSSVPLAEAARRAIAGGAQMVQLREKNMPDAELLKLADRIREITSESGALFIINDRPDVALMCGADGVHLGQDDLPVARARKLFMDAGRNHMLIGASTHALEQARRAAAAGADYVAIGPIFPTKTKGYPRGLGVGIIRKVAEMVDAPIMAIGGITAENVAQVTAAGAGAIAVCSSVISTKDIRAAASTLLSAM